MSRFSEIVFGALAILALYFVAAVMLDLHDHGQVQWKSLPLRITVALVVVAACMLKSP